MGTWLTIIVGPLRLVVRRGVRGWARAGDLSPGLPRRFESLRERFDPNCLKRQTGGGDVLTSWVLVPVLSLIPGDVYPSPQRPGPMVPSGVSWHDLESSQLDALFAAGSSERIPFGRVSGRVILRPGTRLGRFLSRASRPVWQGKRFDHDGIAVNRFFGLPMVRAQVFHGTSWFDGGPAIILNYRETSLVYRRYRDEIREVAPGVYLGLMYERLMTKEPRLVMRFVLEARDER